jgi:hypothetical protein
MYMLYHSRYSVGTGFVFLGFLYDQLSTYQHCDRRRVWLTENIYKLLYS